MWGGVHAASTPGNKMIVVVVVVVVEQGIEYQVVNHGGYWLG